MTQQNWPFENSITGVCSGEVINDAADDADPDDDGDVDADAMLYIVEGQQLGYGRQWEADGKWINRGTWKRASNGTLEYFPTLEEIAAKCALLRTIEDWRGAHARAPRDGEHAVNVAKTNATGSRCGMA